MSRQWTGSRSTLLSAASSPCSMVHTHAPQLALSVRLKASVPCTAFAAVGSTAQHLAADCGVGAMLSTDVVRRIAGTSGPAVVDVKPTEHARDLDRHVIEQFSSYAAHEALRDGVHVNAHRCPITSRPTPWATRSTAASERVVRDLAARPPRRRAEGMWSAPDVACELGPPWALAARVPGNLQPSGVDCQWLTCLGGME